ncbi:carbohydrate ABC transporter permease [Chromohalobacter sp.]|uniref:carbohydrate ABC transporter permease n=1 Tax=Chromohalobacter sp. TaxID=50740 RepID=UPI00257C8DD5|nr:carbohydrate ABC transporter permease [Chromohalobacter sp.]
MIAVLLIYAVFPFYYAVITSLKPSSALFQVEYWLSSVDFSNYVTIFTQGSFVQAIINSIVVAVSVVAIALLLGITAAYALGRVRFRGRTTVMMIVLGVSMFPQVAVLSGLFEVIRTLNLYNSPGGLILSYTIFTLPFTVWVLTTFMRQLPQELEEAAIMDGATPWVTITKVFLPLMWPAMATTGLLAFIAAWNEFLFALTFTLTNEERTVPVAIALISGGSQHELPWGPIMAASVTVTVPLVILVMIFQRRIVSGLTAGAVKG